MGLYLTFNRPAGTPGTPGDIGADGARGRERPSGFMRQKHSGFMHTLWAPKNNG